MMKQGCMIDRKFRYNKFTHDTCLLTDHALNMQEINTEEKIYYEKNRKTKMDWTYILRGPDMLTN